MSAFAALASFLVDDVFASFYGCDRPLWLPSAAIGRRRLIRAAMEQNRVGRQRYESSWACRAGGRRIKGATTPIRDSSLKDGRPRGNDLERTVQSCDC